MQIQDIKQEFANYKRDIDDVSDSLFIGWVNFTVRFIYNKLKGIDPEEFIVTQVYDVTDNVQTELLPVNFLTIAQTVCGFYCMVDGKIQNKKLPLVNIGSNTGGYYFEGNNVVFNNVKNKSFSLKYIPKLTKYTNTNNYITIDGTITTQEVLSDNDMEYIIKAIDVLYSQWVNDPASESLADFRFVRVLEDLLASRNRRPQISIIPNQSNYY